MTEYKKKQRSKKKKDDKHYENFACSLWSVTGSRAAHIRNSAYQKGHRVTLERHGVTQL